MADGRDFTLRGLQAELAERGVKVDYRTVWNFVRAEGLSFKKSVLPSAQERPDIARFRTRWKKYQGRLDPKRLVFIDETWAKTNMAPIRGWALRGRRRQARVPCGHWKTMTFLAALRCDRIDAPCVFDGPINGVSFMTYVEQFLVPTLRPGDIVILDNRGSHKGKAVRRSIRAAGARLLFLPPYSPDLSIRSSRSSPSSNNSCAKPQNEPLTRHGNASATCATASNQTSASDISPMQGTLQPKFIPL
jgi:hypothetical protein